MSLKYLNWHNQGVLQQVVEDLCVEDVDRSVITAAAHQRELVGEVHIPDSFVVVLQVLVGLGAHVRVEPDYLAIVCTQDEVVTSWMYRDGRYPLGARAVFSYYALLLEVVLEDLNVSASEEVRLSRVERYALHNTLAVTERSSRSGPLKTVNHYLTRGLDVVDQSRKVVSL